MLAIGRRVLCVGTCLLPGVGRKGAGPRPLGGGGDAGLGKGALLWEISELLCGVGER